MIRHIPTVYAYRTRVCVPLTENLCRFEIMCGNSIPASSCRVEGGTVKRDSSAALSRQARSGVLINQVQWIVSCLVLATFFCLTASAQTSTTDKMVASVNGELITYSDLVWQLALQPDAPLTSPRSEDLNKALLLVIDQKLIAQEAGKLPSIEPTDAEVDSQLAEFINRFRSANDFYQRALTVGLSAERVREIVRDRVRIEKYLDFRFRTFTIVAAREIEDYYNNVYTPRFRNLNPGVVVPTLDQARASIEEELTTNKISSDIDAFLEDARTRAEIVTLNAV